MSSRTDFKFGYPHVMYGSAIRNMLMVALFNLMKTPLLIWRKRNNCKTLRTFGATLLILKHTKKETQSDYKMRFQFGNMSMKCACVFCCCVLIQNITSLSAIAFLFIKLIMKKSRNTHISPESYRLSFNLLQFNRKTAHMHNANSLKLSNIFFFGWSVLNLPTNTDNKC